MSIQTEIDRINGNIAATYDTLSTMGAEMPAQQNSDNLAATASGVAAVLYIQQALTEEQQAQARENIGAASSSGSSGTPSAHASTHATGGSDSISPASIGAISSSDKGKAGGVATLDSSGKVPSGQIPSLEYAFYAIYGTTTNAEILAAYTAGKAVYMKKDGNNGVYPLIAISGDSYARFGCVIASLKFNRYKCSADNWSEDESVLLAEKPVSAAVTLSASGWNSSSKTQTVTAAGVLADETKQLITPTPALASQAAYYNAGIRCTGQEADSLTFTAKTIPTADLTVYVTIQEVGA